MRRSVVESTLGLAIAMVFATSLSFAHIWGSHKSNLKSANINIASPSKLGKNLFLQPGTYKLEVATDTKSPQVEVLKDGQEVGKATAKLVQEDQKNLYTEVDSTKKGDESVITQIRPSGWTMKLVFKNASRQTPKSGQ